MHVRAERDSARRNASGETGSIPVSTVENLAVEQHYVFALTIRADVGAMTTAGQCGGGNALICASWPSDE